MNRRTLLQVLAAIPVLAVAVPALAAPHKPIRSARLLIDRRRISANAATISFVHRSGIGPAGALRIMARGHAVWLNSVKVTYRGGATQIEKFNINLPPNHISPTVALTHDSSLLRRIDIALEALPLGDGSGEILVWDEPAMDPIHTATE